MKKILFLLVITMCSSSTVSVESNIDEFDKELSSAVASITFQNEFGDLITEDLSNKKTLIVFWADYWGICREELPLLENNLEMLSKTYDVIALAHSDVKPTMEWVKNNLKGTLKIGFSTKELRDKLQVVGQPITLIFDTSGAIISRDFGYIPTN